MIYFFSLTSSISRYAEKSLFNILMRMIAKKAVRRSTRTNELMIESQWISKVVGRKVESEYLFILSLYVMEGI